MKKHYLSLLVALVLYACGDDVRTPARPSVQAYTASQINSIIDQSLQQRQEFRWETVSPEVVSSALAVGDSLLVIGYRPAEWSDEGAGISSWNINTPTWQTARQTILASIQRIAPVSTVYTDTQLPQVVIKTTSAAVITTLRTLAEVRYAEPQGYPYTGVTTPPSPSQRVQSKLGCGNDPESSIPTADFTLLSPDVKVPWNFPYMRIPEAWSYSTGRNIGVALIDTGLSPAQAKLGAAFNQGESSGRSLFRFGTYNGDGPDDQCGHGTQMAGALAAPRGSGGSAVGVAYNANLVGIRGTGDVVIESSAEQRGVIDALKLAGDRADVRIISMSIGTFLWSSSVADAMRYAYGKGKLIFCAAGTSTSFTTWYGVIFPATMSEAVAVTGIVEGAYQACDVCHKGSKVDFVIVMQRANDANRTSLTLAHQGNQPSRVGGSSVATATTSGIAALVWSRNPSLTREQVLDKLKRAGALYPNRSNQYGWGIPDAAKAVTL